MFGNRAAIFCFLMLVLLAVPWARAGDPVKLGGSLTLGGITLPDGYRHQPKLGEDTITGQIGKSGGLVITYSGSAGDIWPDIYVHKVRWRREHEVGSYHVITAFTSDNTILVTFIDRKRVGWLRTWNFEANVNSPEDVAEFMSIVMAFPVPALSPSTQPAATSQQGTN